MTGLLTRECVGSIQNSEVVDVLSLQETHLNQKSVSCTEVVQLERRVGRRRRLSWLFSRLDPALIVRSNLQRLQFFYSFLQQFLTKSDTKF